MPILTFVEGVVVYISLIFTSIFLGYQFGGRIFDGHPKMEIGYVTALLLMLTGIGAIVHGLPKLALFVILFGVALAVGNFQNNAPDDVYERSEDY